VIPLRHSAAAARALLIAVAAIGVSGFFDRGVAAAASAPPAAAAPPPAASAPQAPGPLFVASSPRTPQSGPRERALRATVKRSRTVAINPQVWTGRRDEVPGTLLLNLFDDVSLVAELDRIDPARSGFTWAGHVPGRPLSSVTITTVDGVMAGSIIMPGAVYSIRSLGGAYDVSEIDQSQFPPDAEPRTVSRPQGAAARRAAAEVVSSADTAPVIDVMVLYTAAAVSAAGGQAALLSRINLGIGETNTSYTNSNIAHRVRLVHTQQVAYAEHSDLTLDLEAVSNFDGASFVPTPLGDTAALLRDIRGADVVVLVTAPPSPLYCGIAWLMEEAIPEWEPYAFNVVYQGCLTPNTSIAHEIGHNMGARHDWYVDNGTAPHTYAHGFVNTAARWRTVMAYNNQCSVQSFSCTRLLYWSNPDVLYGGAAMGIPGGTKWDCPTGNLNNVSCDADDHRTLNETAALVAGFRTGFRRAASDFTPDLVSDILWRHDTLGDVWLWPMAGGVPQSETFVRTVAGTNWEIRGLGDQTGDGEADILWRNKATGEIYFWPMSGSTPLSEIYAGSVATGFDIAATGDFDGDGKSDILWRNSMNGEVWIWLMDGAAPLAETFVDVVDPGYAVKGTGDFDGNGKTDIVWHRGATGEVWVWLMDGATRVSQTWVGTVPDTDYQIEGVGDFDGDGKADLLWRHTTRGEVWMWSMDGAARLSEAWIGNVPDTGYRIAATGDYDGDRKADILWHHATRGEVWVWLMDGTTPLSETWVATVPDVGYQIVR
jgi:peptidyl-Asp metalloendopeptidase